VDVHRHGVGVPVSPRSWCAAALLVLASASACSPTQVCPGNCPDNVGVELDLGCGGADLTSVILTGACNDGDATSPALYMAGPTQSGLTVQPVTAGTCHIQLVFGSGYTFSTDVQFTIKNDGSGCPCSQYLQPSVETIGVHDPGSTCASADAGE
jgi:hypothetical protein